MVVRPSGGFHGTIGGGAMEWRALAEAREALGQGRGASGAASSRSGPISRNAAAAASNGGSRRSTRATSNVLRALAEAERADAPARAVYLFGAGHVGRALALALAPLPFAVRWIDLARERVPRARAGQCDARPLEPTRPPNWPSAPDGALVVVMTHSHPLDLAIVAEALRQDRFGYRRPDRLGDQARAVPQPDARGGARRDGARRARLPDRRARRSKARSRR